MTVSENINPKVILEGPFDNGAELAFNFPYADPEHIKVKEDDTLLTYNVDYEVLSHSIEGPTPVLSQVVKLKKAVTGNVTIYRVTPIDQQAEFPQAQKFNSGKLNEALDKICMQQQEQQEAIDRSLKITNSLVGQFDMMLPTPSANDVLRWDVTGSKLENYDIKEFEAGVQAQIDIIEDTANAAAANASDAVSTANAATVVANSASSTASTAATNASAAVSTANEASTTANTASAVASAASTTATNAKSTADTAAAKVDQFGESIGAVIEAAGKISDLEAGITAATNAAATATNAATAATNAANTASTAAESATSAAATATAKAEEVSQELVTKEDKANKGVAGGYASLGEDGKVPAEQLDVDLSTVQQIAEKGVANGYAGLDADGKVPIAQLPNIGLEPCDIGMALYVDETKGLRRYLNGQIVDINTNTQAFLNRLQQITTLHPSLLCTEEEWQTAKTSSAFGQVGKFVFNYSGADIVSVRIPRVVNVQGLFDLQNLGMTVDESLPNIKGSVYLGTTTVEGTGAMSVDKLVGHGSSSGNSTDRIKFNASDYNTTYQDNAHVQQEAIQYPYFIQIATGSETENNIINDIELNNPYSLFECKYSDHELFNLSWLVSNGSYNGSNAVHPSAYQALLVEKNAEVAIGSTVTLPSGINYTKQGLSVKLSTETYTDYDFVVNPANETFRPPIKPNNLNNTRYLIEKGEQDGVNYRIYSDGYCEQWGFIPSQTRNDNLQVTLLKEFVDTNYNLITNKWIVTNTTASVAAYSLYTKDKTTSGFTTSIDPNLGCSWRASGYLAQGEYTPLTDNILLYYYVGETVQNANLINAGRIGEQLAGKVDLNASNLNTQGKSYISGLGMPSSRYVDLTLGASGTKYVAPANGYFFISKIAGQDFYYCQLIALKDPNSPLEYNNMLHHTFVSDYRTSPCTCILPVKKGDTVAVDYNATGVTNLFRFIYAEGENN